MIVLTTLHNEAYQSLADWTLEKNKRIYCEKHGYPLITMTSGWHNIPIGFEKAYLLQKALDTYPECQWIFFTECDAMITNFNIRLEDILSDVPEDIVFVVGNDGNGINAGNFFLRNSMKGREFLQEMFDAIGNFEHEQAFFIRCYFHDPTHPFKKHMKIAPQWSFNSYDYDLIYSNFNTSLRPLGVDTLGHRGQWQIGDFLIHWPAMNLHQRLEQAKKYTQYVQY